ncbi:glycerol-3-phosphate dehydrogenase/oxidase [Ancylobacter lacus]|nr:glycerol-3-phosphate dehydrogenase/oxidase [Ancylobacter lacus]
MRTRDTILDRLRRGEAPPVLIVGAGINGVGVYWDLALQGVPALLIDRGDICSGTSSAPSRLIHGGLRYLEIGEFGLVRESVEERNRLLLDAPHYVRPIPVWVPIDSRLGGAAASVGRFLGLVRRPGPKGAFVVKLGLMAYDLFGRTNRTMPDHRMVPAAEFRRAMPDLAPSARYMAEYYDARLTAPERLGLELVGDAEAACPAALAATYVRLAGREGGAVTLEDTLSGERFTVRPELVVNCAGAWVDRTDAPLGIDDRLIGGTKGSHLVLDHPDFAARLGGRMLYFETADHRVCLAYPLDARRVLLGTTDIRTDDPEDTVCSAAEIDYLFDVMRAVMPGLVLDRAQIVFTYAGVRPLPYSDEVAGAISRDHSVRVFEPAGGRPFPVLALVGGKWTTFRPCAGEIVDLVLARLGRSRAVPTEAVGMGGGKGFPTDETARRRLVAELAGRHGRTPARIETLLDRYGMRALDMLARGPAGPETMLAALPDYSTAELASIAENERIATLADVVLRRTQIGLLGLATPAVLVELGAVVGAALGWPASRIGEETARTAALLATRHGVPERA